MNRKITFSTFVLAFLLIASFTTKAQDPNRFKSSIKELSEKEYNFNPDKKLIVFTGSSSIYKWKDVADYFPDYNVVNFGFGGSHYSDLIYWYDKLITRFQPDYLFIYEGDNDIAAKKKPGKVYKQAKGLIKRVKSDLPKTEIIIISAKPSIARWNLSKGYKKLNKKLNKFCDRQDHVAFANVWDIMLDKNGNVMQDIFIEDGLHMNAKGYNLWKKELDKYLK